MGRMERWFKVNVLVVGDFMLDEYILGSVNRISPEAPVPVLEVKERQIKLGGAGNVINNIISFGAKATVLTRIGQDGNGNYLKRELEKMGVETKHIFVDGELNTIIKTRIVAKNQQFLRYDEETVRDISESYVDYVAGHIEEIFHNINVVLISDYGKGVVTKQLAGLLIGYAKEHQIPVVVDPKGKDYSKYRYATICTPNMNELEQVSGHKIDTEEQVLEAGLKLCEDIQLDVLLVTRSEKGISSIFRGSDSKNDYPAVAKEVVDVTGAGDTVISVVSLAVASGYSIEEACQLANKAASIVISKFGCATTTVKELRKLSDYDDKKIVDEETLAEITEHLKSEGKRIVFTNGCFDILHAGHISSFEQAKTYGDVLVVGLNSDASIKRIKGDKRPIVEEKYRAKLLASLNIVDYVTVFEEDTPEHLIQKISPNVLVKGKDWMGKTVAGQDFLEEAGGEVQFIDLEQGLSTTNIIKKIQKTYTEVSV